jgi:quercetin dioxygenase-like cupin family protein
VLCPQEDRFMDEQVYRAALSAEKTARPGWGNLTWLASAEIGNAEGLTLGRVVIKAGQSNPRHAHPSCEEVLYLMAGRLEHSIGGRKVILEPGDTLTVPAGVFHNAVSIGTEDADMIVAYSSAARDFVEEQVP